MSSEQSGPCRLTRYGFLVLSLIVSIYLLIKMADSTSRDSNVWILEFDSQMYIIHKAFLEYSQKFRDQSRQSTSDRESKFYEKPLNGIHSINWYEFSLYLIRSFFFNIRDKLNNLGFILTWQGDVNFALITAQR